MKITADVSDSTNSLIVAGSSKTKLGPISKKKMSVNKLDATASNLADMFSFPADDVENDENVLTPNKDKENDPDAHESSTEKSRFQSQKKSKNLVLRKSSFFLPKSEAISPLKSKTNVSLNSKVNSSSRQRQSLSAKKPRKSNTGTLVTSEMISRVCKTATEKETMPKNGYSETACHQCRVKSSDTKTICHSDGCSKGRGSICGVCLSLWYNEDAVEALKNKVWTCLSCRGECQCNVCRVKRNLNELPKTIASTSLMLGFASVKEYLESKQKSL